jgi:beta-glucanase (GH16 family)
MTTPSGNTPPVSVTRLTFEDTFSSFSASATGVGTTWQDLYPYGGEAAHDLSGNSEAEYYSSALPGQYNSPFSDGNGVLTISAFPAPGGSDPYNLPYTSGVITTAQSFAQTYGYFEIDAKLPSGQGLWPAFWMLPTDGYTAELDDFEFVNNTNTIYSTVHGSTNGTWGSDSQAYDVSADNLSNSFNVYGVNWTPTTVTYYINGVAYLSEPTPQSMDSPMYMLINLAVGGNGSWPGAPNSSTVFPANMQIAWVEAYATPDTTYVGGSAAIPAGSSAAAVPAATSTTTSTTTTSTTTTDPATTAATTTTAAAAVTPGNPAPVTFGSGPDTLSLQMSEDYYLGDAQFVVSVDGVQQGGTYTTTAIKSLGESQTFNIEGTFAPGAHTVSVAFLNDAWGGTSATDRNLYVGSATIDGTAVPNSSLTELITGSQSFNFTEPGSTTSTTSTASTSASTTTTPTPTSSTPAPVTFGSGPDTLTLEMAEDYYLGNAEFTVSIDGVQQGGTYTTTAINGLDETQAFNFEGTFSPGSNTVSVDFLNDAWGGTSAEDRNLYVNAATIDGSVVANASLSLYNSGTQNFSFTEPGSTTSPTVTTSSTSSTTTTATTTNPNQPAPVTIGSGPDTMSLQIAEDYYLGNASFTVSVDGVQQGGTYSTTAIQDLGQTQEFNVEGTFGAGTHTVTVDFLNDAYGGSASLDRNLYVDSASFNGTTVANANLSEYGAGSQSFSFTGNAAETGVTQPAPVAIATAGSTQASPDTLVVGLTEDAYQGNAIASIAIDGKTIATPTVSFLNSNGTAELFTYTGDFGGANIAHTVSISFTNDLYGGSASLDRNLYVQSVSFDGSSHQQQTELYSNGTVNITVPATTTSILLPNQNA